MKVMGLFTIKGMKSKFFCASIPQVTGHSTISGPFEMRAKWKKKRARKIRRKRRKKQKK
jgi:hypothetical protein